MEQHVFHVELCLDALLVIQWDVPNAIQSLALISTALHLSVSAMLASI